MKKYFVCSDIHSFFNEWMEAINKEGFDKNNQNHILIVAGDLFDRGNQSKECLDFVKEMLSKKRLIYIIGNHEFLLLECLQKPFPQHHDFTNGTVKTICHLAGENFEKFDNWGTTSYAEMQLKFSKMANKLLALGIEDLIKTQTVKYAEIGKYIITHSFIPLKLKTNKLPTQYERIYSPNSEFEYNPNWRKDATNGEWFGATWFNPAEKYDAGFFKEEAKQGKYLVVGHWGTFLIHKHYEGGLIKHHEIYKHKNLICLDATTVLSEKINCLVITD